MESLVLTKLHATQKHHLHFIVDIQSKRKTSDMGMLTLIS